MPAGAGDLPPGMKNRTNGFRQGKSRARRSESRPPAGRRAPQRPAHDPAGSFKRLLRDGLKSDEQGVAHAAEPLAALQYERELQLKNGALAAFWRQHDLTGRPERIVRSPCARHYRTTTRRRAISQSGKLFLGFAEDRVPETPVPVSALEPREHTAIYRFLAEDLSAPRARSVAAHLNYAIIRGSYDSFCVVLNLDRLDAGIVRGLKGVAERLQTVDQRIFSCFAFHDPSRSEYYFEHEAPPVPVRLKRLFGPPRIPLHVEGRRYDLPPTSFSQVNQSMVPPMLQVARDLLQPQPEDRLLDLFCGYGLFARALGPACREVIGLDADREAINSAVNGSVHDTAESRITFLRRNISERALIRSLPAPAAAELVILDPPRQGVDTRIIAYLGARRPRRILHIACGIETVPAALQTWEASGLRLRQCVPLDMFPGTMGLETLMLLEPLPRQK